MKNKSYLNNTDFDEGEPENEPIDNPKSLKQDCDDLYQFNPYDNDKSRNPSTQKQDLSFLPDSLNDHSSKDGILLSKPNYKQGHGVDIESMN